MVLIFEKEQAAFMRLADVYAIVSYSLKHKKQVRAYLLEREKRAKAIRRKVAARSHNRNLKNA